MQEDMVSMLRMICSCDYVIMNKYATWLDCTKKRLQCRGMFVIFFLQWGKQEGPLHTSMQRGHVQGIRKRTRKPGPSKGCHWKVVFSEVRQRGKSLFVLLGIFLFLFRLGNRWLGWPCLRESEQVFFFYFLGNQVAGGLPPMIGQGQAKRKEKIAGRPGPWGSGPGSASQSVCLSVCLSVSVWNSIRQSLELIVALGEHWFVTLAYQLPHMLRGLVWGLTRNESVLQILDCLLRFEAG